MKRVVERCPNCGVEHDEAHGGACEVCGTPLRYWCRMHSREIGWLDAPECPRCAAETASRPRVAPPPPRTHAPPPPPPRREAPPRVEAPPPRVPPEAPPRRPRSIVVSPSPGERTGGPPPYAGRDPRDVVRETADDLAPHVATGARVAGRMFRALLAVLFAVIGWGLFGALAGGGYAYYALGQGAGPGQGVDVVWGAMFGATIGGGFGLFIGFIRAIRTLFAQPRRDG